MRFANVEGDGLRRVPQSMWAEVCKDAKCSILHHESNRQFDAYLLSESSLFIFPDRMIAKTCGQTTLLNLVPHLFTLAEAVGARPAMLTVRSPLSPAPPPPPPFLITPFSFGARIASWCSRAKRPAGRAPLQCTGLQQLRVPALRQAGSQAGRVA